MIEPWLWKRSVLANGARKNPLRRPKNIASDLENREKSRKEKRAALDEELQQRVQNDMSVEEAEAIAAKLEANMEFLMRKTAKDFKAYKWDLERKIRLLVQGDDTQTESNLDTLWADYLKDHDWVKKRIDEWSLEETPADPLRNNTPSQRNENI